MYKFMEIVWYDQSVRKTTVTNSFVYGLQNREHLPKYWDRNGEKEKRKDMLDMFENLAHASEVLALRAWQKSLEAQCQPPLTFFFLVDIQFYLKQIW